MGPLTEAVAAKIYEQIELTVRLAGMVTDLEWRPPISGAWSCGELLGHLLDCMAGICAVLYAAHPDQLGHFSALRELPVIGVCGQNELRERAGVYRAHMVEGFAALSDDDLARRLPTVFVPSGECVLTLLLGNLEHLINHKHQLFTYLKLSGADIGTAELYALRG